MELARLNDTDLLDSKEIYIREKSCSDCKEVRVGARIPTISANTV